MDSKTTGLLDQLRIDRTAGAHTPEAGSRAAGRRGRWLIGIGVAVLVLLAFILWRWNASHAGVQVRTAVAKALAASGGSAGGSLLDASGYVVALRQATVSAKSIYKVNELLVQEGQAVKQGDVMARLDDTNTRAALEQSKAQVKQLEAALAAARQAVDDARPTFQRSKAQQSEGLISSETFEAVKATYDAAQNTALIAQQSLAVAKATVEINQRFEDDTVIKAPFDGVVTAKNAQPGEIVSPQFQGGGGIAKVVDMDSLEVDVDVSENFINRVYSKQPATITLNAYPEVSFPAEVIAVIPTADRAKATVKVRIAFKKKDPRVVPEMGARVSFLDDAAHAPRTGESSAPRTAGVLVPADAVQGEGDHAVVFVVDDDKVERRTVRLGARSGDSQTILSGVRPGTAVAVGDLAQLKDGLKVSAAQ